MIQRGTASNYRDVLNKLDQFITNRHVSEVAVNAAGTGYVAGEILMVAGGTVEGGMECKLEVLTVDTGGEILTLRIYDSGAYSVDPTTTANAVIGGSGSSATIDLTMADTGWTQRIKVAYPIAGTIRVSGGTISVDGSGYAVADIVTLADAVSGDTKAQFKVTAVSGSGDVLEIELYDGGSYTGSLSGTYATTGGSGTGLTITIISSASTGRLDYYMWEGEGTGGNSVFVGMRTEYNTSISQPSIGLYGFSGFISGSDFDSQPGVNPATSFMPAVNSSMPFWFFVSKRRIVIVFQASGSYISGHLGLLDPFGTDVELPYPMFICGTTDDTDRSLGEAPVYFRSIADPVGYPDPPGWIRVAGTWQSVANGTYSTSIGSTVVGGRVVYPCGETTMAGLAEADRLGIRDTPEWMNFIVANRVGMPSCLLMPCPDSGGNKYVPVPCTIVQGSTTQGHSVLGEINGVFWVHGVAGLAAEDRLVCSDRYFRVFQMGVNSLPYAYFCVEEV